MRGARARPGPYQLAVHVRVRYGDVRIAPARTGHIRADRRVRRATPPLQHTRSRQHLRAVANGRNRLVRLEEVPRDLQPARSDGCTPARATGDDQRVIVFGPHLVNVALSWKLWPGFSL